MRPSGSVADALTVTVAGAMMLAPTAGAVTATVGNWFAADVTVIVAALDVAVPPSWSNAMAVSE
jgi:hypothetical protein